MRALTGQPKRISVRGFSSGARTQKAERLKSKYQNLGWIFIRSDETKMFSSHLQFLAPKVQRKRPSRLALGGLALLGGLSVAVFALSGTSSTIRQSLQERRFALEQLLPQTLPWRAAAVEEIATSMDLEPVLSARPRHVSETTHEEPAQQPIHRYGVSSASLDSARSDRPVARDGYAHADDILARNVARPEAIRNESWREMGAARTNGSSENSSSNDAEELMREAARRFPIVIPSDPKAEYFVLERTRSPKNPTLVIERVGPSGVTFSKMAFDCKAHKFKYIAGGDTLAALARPAPPRAMGILFEGSSSDYWWHLACNTAKTARR
jgi:hypothetical protein